MFVAGSAMLLKNFDCISGPRDMVSFINHAPTLAGHVNSRLKARRRRASLPMHQIASDRGTVTKLFTPKKV
jgi:hypothetical protein